MINKTVFVVALAASLNLAGLARSQAAGDGVLILKAVEQPTPKMEDCKEALERGTSVKTDSTGALHIPFGGFYFLIQVDEKEMRCSMYRHVFSG